LFALLIAIVLMAGACSSDDEGGSGDDSPPPTTEPSDEATGEPILVGQIVPIEVESGLSLVAQARGLEAAIEAFNGRGGVDGRPLELVQCDSQNDPNRDAECAQEMVDAGVVATLADTAGADPAAVNEILGAAGIPRIGAGQTGLADYESTTLFNFTAGAVGVVLGLMDLLTAEGHEAITLIRPDVPASAALVGLVGPAVEAAGGEIVNDLAIPAGTTDYTPIIAAAEANGATGVALALSLNEGEQVLNAANQLGTDLVFAATSATFPVSVLAEQGEVAEAMLLADDVPSATSVETFPSLEQVLGDFENSGFEELANIDDLATQPIRSYLTVQAFVEVMTGAETIDAASVQAAFEAAEGIDMLDLVPPWTPSVTQEGLFTNVSNPTYYRSSFDGEVVTTDPDSTFDVIEFLNAGS
jgi:ABC-type branched-subunit amino acid transport system substrate-binding protein